MDRGLPIAGGAAAQWALPSLPTRLPLNGSIEGSMHEPPPTVRRRRRRPSHRNMTIPTKLSASWFGDYSTMHAVWDRVSKAMSKAAKSFVPDGSREADCSGALLLVGCSASFPSPRAARAHDGAWKMTLPRRLWLANATTQTLHVLRSRPSLCCSHGRGSCKLSFPRSGRILVV